ALVLSKPNASVSATFSQSSTPKNARVSASFVATVTPGVRDDRPGSPDVRPLFCAAAGVWVRTAAAATTMILCWMRMKSLLPLAEWAWCTVWTVERVVVARVAAPPEAQRWISNYSPSSDEVVVEPAPPLTVAEDVVAHVAGAG